MDEFFQHIITGLSFIAGIISFIILFYSIKDASRHRVHVTDLYKFKLNTSIAKENVKTNNDKSTSNEYIINKAELSKELDRSRNFNKKFKYVTYFLAILISILGTILLFFGIILSFYSSDQLNWITVSSGIIVELISVIYFWLITKTTKEVKKDNERLMREVDFLLANELIDKIQDDKIKDETYVKMIESLITKKY